MNTNRSPHCPAGSVCASWREMSTEDHNNEEEGREKGPTVRSRQLVMDDFAVFILWLMVGLLFLKSLRKHEQSSRIASYVPRTGCRNLKGKRKGKISLRCLNHPTTRSSYRTAVFARVVVNEDERRKQSLTNLCIAGIHLSLCNVGERRLAFCKAGFRCVA